MFIYHIVLPEAWERSKTKASYQPESLTTEGFIHCSYPSQLEAVLKRYYSGVEKVLILKIDTEKLLSKLVKEPSTDDELYPHIYGRLNHNAVVEVRERVIKGNGFEGSY
ncbi:MAG: DUF952 domain-containing protein [Pyrinomonadaceae bacterium]